LVKKDFIIYCDGACQGNPGKSGSGLAVYNKDKEPVLIYGRFNANGTNNTAELNALYRALEIAKEYIDENIQILADSKYAIDCISVWAYNWKKKGWTKKGGEIKNLEIIQKAHKLYDEIKDNVKLAHVKAHSGIEGNELADRMAIYAIHSKTLGFKKYDYNSISEVLSIS
jgi:ribonuclease HI